MLCRKQYCLHNIETEVSLSQALLHMLYAMMMVGQRSHTPLVTHEGLQPGLQFKVAFLGVELHDHSCSHIPGVSPITTIPSLNNINIIILSN